MLSAITFDYWDTLYHGHTHPERYAMRQGAVRLLLRELGQDLPEERFQELYRASGAEAARWWQEERRGYKTGDRLRWLLSRLEIERPQDCEIIAEACRTIDESLVRYAPALIPGARETVASLAERFPLGIISDTGFASSGAQDRLLERDGMLDYFAVRIYSADVGHAKPRPEPFIAAVNGLGKPAAETVHVGDLEHTDVAGALASGLRAVRLDVVRRSGDSAAERVVRSFDELLRHLDRG